MFRVMLSGIIAVLLTSGIAQAQNSTFAKTVKGNPNVQSIDAIDIGPGVLLIGDSQGQQVVAVKLDAMPATKWTMSEMSDIRGKLAERIGTTGKGIEIRKLAVDQSTGLAYFAVRKLAGKQDLILTVNAQGKINEFPLENVEYASIALPGGKDLALRTITDIAWSPRSILVSVQANESFDSKIVVIPTPITNGSNSDVFGADTYHVAHRRWETKAPIRTVLPYEQNGESYLIGAFTCTPIVKYSLSNLKSGAKVKGQSLIEIGAGNTPRDMFVYSKNGKKYILMSTFRFHHSRNPVGPSPYWTVKVDYDLLAESKKVNEEAVRRVKSKASENLLDTTSIVADYHGVAHMGQLNATQALVVRTDGKEAFDLAVLPLP